MRTGSCTSRANANAWKKKLNISFFGWKTPTFLKLFSSKMQGGGLAAFANDQYRQAPVDGEGGTMNRAELALPAELWIRIFHLSVAQLHDFPLGTTQTLSLPSSFESSESYLHPIHVQAYNKCMKFKCNLTLVCQLWYTIAQEVLLERIWITHAKEALSLADMLVGRGLERDVGRHIRELRIDTASYDRCSPASLLTIIKQAPFLQVFCDYQSIRRIPTVQIVSPAMNSPQPPWSFCATRDEVIVSTQSAFGDRSFRDSSALAHSRSYRPSTDSEMADSSILSALCSHPQSHQSTGLRNLTWTNYHYNPRTPTITIYENVIGPQLHRLTQGRLETLELMLFTNDEQEDMSGDSEAVTVTGTLDLHPNFLPGVQIHANTLTSLSTSLNSSPSYTDFKLPPHGRPSSLNFPALQFLKVTLDDTSLHVLAKWEMPRLQTLCLVPADGIAYSRDGLAELFSTHGHKLVELELGYSSYKVGSSWLASESTYEPFSLAGPIPLAEWCPYLQRFIYTISYRNASGSSILPLHALLPSHHSLQVVGIRGLGHRIVESLYQLEAKDAEALAAGEALSEIESATTGEIVEDSEFSTLIQHFDSVLDKKLFPNLRCVQDLNLESALMRTSGRVPAAAVTVASGSSYSSDTKQYWTGWTLGNPLRQSGESLTAGYAAQSWQGGGKCSGVGAF
ncbi:hypothetical protein H1R20_g4139, partial [Candolleomyces eurysporus]